MKKIEGRPKIPPDQIRAAVAVRLNDEEKALLTDVAHDAGLELSTWIRMVALAAARSGDV